MLARHGCKAANYRLSGHPVDHLCVVTLGRDFRMIIGFPAPGEVAVLLIGRHVNSPSTNVYERLYRLLGAENPGEPRNKPPCCEDGNSTVDQHLVDFLAGRILTFESQESD